MSTDTFRVLAELTGIGGVALGVILLVFQQIIRKNDPAKLGRTNSFRLLRLMVIAVWSVGFCGVAAWTMQYILKPATGTSQQVQITGDGNQSNQTAHQEVGMDKDAAAHQQVAIQGKGNTVVQNHIGAKP